MHHAWDQSADNYVMIFVVIVANIHSIILARNNHLEKETVSTNAIWPDSSYTGHFRTTFKCLDNRMWLKTELHRFYYAIT